MSPEQVQSRRIVVDHRTDIYSLGATLYELLTLRPAFDGDSPQDVMRRVIQEEPTSPRRVNPNIPRDLETIVLTAMAKERDDRYTTAKELAEDLRRLLDRRPIQARRPSPLDRASRWARQHRKVVATSIAVLLTVVVGLSGVVIVIARAERRAVSAERLAEERERESRYESLIQQIVRLRLTSHSNGWSNEAWHLVYQIANIHPKDRGAFQAQAAAALMGFDAHLLDEIPAPASSLSFDPTERRLWMGGLKQELRTWDGANHRVETRGPAMEGPIAFRADGTPLQLGVTRDANTGMPALQLWDAARQSAKVITLPDGATQIIDHAISPDGTTIGAVVELAEGARTILFWETATGRSLPQIKSQAARLAFAPDASLVAAWGEAGKIGLWSLPECVPVGMLPAGDTPIQCIAFGRAHGLAARKTAAVRWLLAAGDAGGKVTIWDLKKQIPMDYYRGSSYHIYSVAFSPDGTTLASAGRTRARLWDVATGRFLLSLRIRNTMTALAFSPDGTRLAVGSRTAFGSPGGVDVYQLDQGRGIRTFRGLRGPVPKTIFSPDGQLVVGLSQDWRVAIWDPTSGQLRITLDVPQGFVADNSGLAFSPESKRFAFSAGRQAKLWDVETGKELGAWLLPEGLQDTIAFRGLDQLLLLRRERSDVRIPLYSAENLENPPRVMRLRNLLGARPTEPIRVITDFNRFVHHTAATPDGKYFVVEGVGGPGEGTRSVNAYDASSGLRLWSLPSRKRLDVAAWFEFDPTSKVLSLDEGGDHSILLDMPSRAILGSLSGGARCLSPNVRRWLGIESVNSTDGGLIFSIREKGLDPPLLQLAINSRDSSVVSRFSPDGRHVIWGNGEGSVSICDLDEVRFRLAEVGLGW